MQYVILGKTGLRVSRVGFGGIPIQRIEKDGARALFDALADCGVNYIDTARGYTVSAEYIGEAIDGRRDEFILATKSMARDKEGMARDIETSLSNLRTDRIDLYQVHNPSMEQLDAVIAEGGALEALEEAKRAGKIDHIGITAHSLAVFERALELDWVETVMFPYNIVESQCAEEHGCSRSHCLSTRKSCRQSSVCTDMPSERSYQEYRRKGRGLYLRQQGHPPQKVSRCTHKGQPLYR